MRIRYFFVRVKIENVWYIFETQCSHSRFEVVLCLMLSLQRRAVFARRRQPDQLVHSLLGLQHRIFPRMARY